MKGGYVYLMANRCRGQTYLGVTSNLPARAHQHRTGAIAGHSRTKGCTILVWYEGFDDLQDARACEWRMKKWKRSWKIRVIEEQNPEWRDLFEALNQ